MRIIIIVLLSALMIASCENPQEQSVEPLLYKGRVVQPAPAPFLLNNASLSKVVEESIVLDDEVPEGTVYGLKNDTTVYAADGGEVLPKKSWVDNTSSNPVQVSVSPGLVITFEHVTEVTILEASQIIYIAANGDEVLFSGSGVITTSQISTGSAGHVVLISTAEFAIGSEGGEWG